MGSGSCSDGGRKGLEPPTGPQLPWETAGKVGAEQAAGEKEEGARLWEAV